MQGCLNDANLPLLSRPFTNNQHIINKVLSYLQAEDLQLINNVLLSSSQPHPLSPLIKTHHYFKNYLNKVDRSLYFSFYQLPQFRKLQQLHTLLLTNNQRIQFQNFSQAHHQIHQLFASLLPSFLETTQIIQQIDRFFVDPDLPLPKLKRENQGIFCKTSFQNFLVSLRKTHFQEFPLLDCLEGLKQYYISQQNNYLKNVFLKAKKNQLTSLKIHSLRFTPYDITFENMEQFLCEKCSLHNVLVCIFAFIDVWLCSTKVYIESLSDPFHRHIEFLTRYSIYRNIIMCIEENVGFLFSHYNELYSEVYIHNKPNYNFWRPALTKWLIKMEEMHEECNQVYHYSFTKLRMDNLLRGLSELEKEKPEIFMSLRNKLELREYEIEINQHLKKHGSSQIEEYFENNLELYEISAIQYIEYMVDLSVNEETVHWCGHSKQYLSEPYLSFQNNLVQCNLHFIKHLTALLQEEDLKETIFEVFNIQANIFKKLEVKPVTMYKLIDNYNSLLPYISEEEEEQTYINFNFISNDDLLSYYNDKHSIRFSVDKEEQKFYNINSVLSADQLVKKSISTAVDSIYEDKSEEEDNELSDVIGLIRHSSEMLCDMDIEQKQEEPKYKQGEDT